ncbi:hypothetical protein [Halonotius sp. GCM10025705]|uniref:hypothetical protein n=1 Tax=Halonotius sp. GCM10025705 TaxID=3252678 RepID=UPI003606BFFF
MDTAIQYAFGRCHRPASVARGNRRLGALLLGVAFLAYRWSPVGIALTLLYHRYGDQITRRALDGDA